MSPSIELQNKIIGLVKSILNYYQSLESNSSIKYYAHNEFDTNLTEFEGMSNSRKIVLATSLDPKFVPIIIRIFQCVYDSNYWIFEDVESVSDPDEINNEELLELLTFSNSDPWIKYLEIAYNEDLDQNGRYIGNEEIYNSVPSVDTIYYKSKKQQKIYKIIDIIKLLEKE